MKEEAELGPCLTEEGGRNREIEYKKVKKEQGKEFPLFMQIKYLSHSSIICACFWFVPDGI